LLAHPTRDSASGGPYQQAASAAGHRGQQVAHREGDRQAHHRVLLDLP
jgi:hypothetical protein